MMGGLLEGFGDAFSLMTLIAVIGGVAIGIVVGALPGLNAPMAVAVAVPLTYGLRPLTAIAFLIGVLKGAAYGGSISAILLNTPGTPGAAATALDGYPLTQKGYGDKALRLSLFAAFFGGALSDFVLVLFAVPIGHVAIRLGPPEFTAILLVALATVAFVTGRSTIKGLMSAALGLLLSCVGLDPVSGAPRFTFGIAELQGGIPLAVIGIGMLALSEILVHLGKGAKSATQSFSTPPLPDPHARRLTLKEIRGVMRTLFRSSFIGMGIGVMPGLGASVAGFLGYGAAKATSPRGRWFGRGELEGVAASEAAIAALVSATMIPLLALGVPGNVAAAMLTGAFVLHGVQPGPLMFEAHPRLVYGIFAAMMLATWMNAAIGSVGFRMFARIARLPMSSLLPVIVLLCLTGVYLAESSLFAVVLTLAVAVLGYCMRQLGFPFIPFIIAFVVGPNLEFSLQQTLIAWQGDVTRIAHHPIAITLIVLAVLVFAVSVLRRMLRATTGAE
jgi:putative tricarboxylic transport membrane protein